MINVLKNIKFVKNNILVIPRTTVFKRYNGTAATQTLIQPLSQIPSSSNKINFTKQAVQRLSALALSGDSLSIKVTSGGCHGYQYDLTLLSAAKLAETTKNDSKNQTQNKNETKKEEEEDDDEDDDFESTELTKFKLPFLKPDERDLVGLSRSIKKTSPDSTSEKLPTEKDLKEKDVSVVIDSDSLALLNGTTLDFQRELIGSSFKIVGGNMKSSCGCGSSFDL